MNGAGEETQTQASEGLAHGGAGVSAPAPSSAVDPAEYEQLRAYRDQTSRTFEALNPVADDIQWMLADEENLNFIRKAREQYQSLRTAREPELDANGKILLDKFGPALEYVNDLRAREKQQTEAQQAEYVRRVRSERDALTKEKPWLTQPMIESIGVYGDRLGIQSLKEAADRFFADRDPSASAEAKTPPRSLRGEASAAGVPGPSTLPPIKSPKDIRARLKSAFANQGR